MEPLLILLGIGALIYFLLGPGIAWHLASKARQESKELRDEVWKLRAQLERLQSQMAKRADAVIPSAQPLIQPAPPSPTPVSLPVPAAPVSEPIAPPPPPLPTFTPPAPSIASELPKADLPPPPDFSPAVETIPYSEPSLPVPGVKPASRAPAAAISLEQFLGVKLFAWIGGLALFLGIVFFVKYAFEQNLISPALRTTIGFLIGGGLVTTGIIMRRSQAYAVLAQTLAATGALILYGVTYAAHALYEFPAFTTLSTFAYMSLITAGAFALAVWIEAPVIAVLGMAGGFLTPVFVNSGVDNPTGLFGYVLLIDLGLIAVAKKRGWHYLMACGAAGTLLLESGWFFEWFWKGDYHLSEKIWIPISVHLFFPTLFALATWWLRPIAEDGSSTPALRQGSSLWPALGGLALAGWNFVVAFIFLGHAYITDRPLILNGFLFALNAAVLMQIWVHPRTALAQWIAALLSFVHLAVWSTLWLTDATLIPALISYLIFGLMHTGFALLAMRKRPETMQAQRHGIWLGPVAVLLVIAPMFALPEVPWLIWPTVLLINLMTMAVAAVTLAIAPVLLALVVTLVAMTVWLFFLDTGASPWLFLFTLGGFALVFAAAGALLSFRLRMQTGHRRKEGADWLVSLEGLLPMASAALPFVLLILATHRLHLVNPTPVFTLGVLLSLGLLVLMRLSSLPALGMAALICMWLLELSWLERHFDPARPWMALGWFLGVASLFAGYPFLWKSRFRETALPWIVSAITWLMQGLLIYWVCDTLPALKGRMGWVPALLVLPPSLSFWLLWKSPAPSTAPDSEVQHLVRRTQLAWFGGVALTFITLIFPIQFDHQWLTLGWALEGAALCWLFTRVPHPGLVRLGFSLLTSAFVRLSVNPAVLGYQPHQDTPIWNWFLYTYGIAALAMFAAARWLTPERLQHLRESEPSATLGGKNPAALCWTYGGILLFLLVNLEIADYFTPAGSLYIDVQWGGNFARSMTFSIAWALYALALLIIGFRLDTKAARYAGIGLMGITLLKLFFHDLANIGSIYRIGALIVVAVIALGASFLYQRFYARKGREE